MANNSGINRKYTVQLDISTKDAEAQIKSLSNNYKKILSDFSGAASKMNVFKDLVDYITQVDTALNRLKNENPIGFKNFFGGLDANLTKSLEEIFDLSNASVNVVNELNERIDKAVGGGSRVADLRSIATDINSLFVSMGKTEPINVDEMFYGKGDPKERIDILKTSINSLMDTIASANVQLGQGLNFGSIKPQDATALVEAQIQNLKKQKDDLNDTVNEIEATLNRLKDLRGIEGYDDGKKITMEDFEKSQKTYKNISRTFKGYTGDKQSQTYFKLALAKQQALAEYYENAMRLSTDIENSDLYDSQGDQFGDKLDGTIQVLKRELISGDAYKALGKFLSTYKKDAVEIESTIDKLQSKISSINTNGNITNVVGNSSDVVNNNKKIVASYDEVISKIREYMNLSKKMDADDLTDEGYNKYEAEQNSISQYLSQISNVDEEEIFSLFNKIDNGKISIEDMTSKIVKSFGGEIPIAIGESTQSLAEFYNVVDKVEGKIEQGKSSQQKPSGNISPNMENVVDTNVENLSPNTGISSEITNTIIQTESAEIQNKIVSGANTISDSIKNVKSGIDSLRNTIDSIGNTTTSRLDKISADIQSFKVDDEAIVKQQELETMKKNLLEFQRITNEHNKTKDVSGLDRYTDQELGAIVFSDGKIGYSYGEDGSVPWDRYYAMMADNLHNKPTVNLHSHPFRNIWTGGQNNPGENTVLSQSDFYATKTSQKVGSSIDAMLNGNIMSVFDFANVSRKKIEELTETIKQVSLEFSKIQKYTDVLSFNEQGKISLKYTDDYASLSKTQDAAKDIYLEALKRTGLSNNFKTYDLTNNDELTELARLFVDTNSQQANDKEYNATVGLTKLLTAKIGETEVNTPKIQSIIHQFELGAITAKDAFKQATGEMRDFTTKWVGDNAPSTKSELNNISSILLDISNNLQSILNNIQKTDVEQVKSQLDSLHDFDRNGTLKGNVFNKTESLFDPTNNSESYVNQLKKRYEDIFDNAQTLATDLYFNKENASYNELQQALSEFSNAVGAFRDYVNQKEFYTFGEAPNVKSFNDYQYTQTGYQEVHKFSDLYSDIASVFESYVKRNTPEDNIKDSSYYTADLKDFANTIAAAIERREATTPTTSTQDVYGRGLDIAGVNLSNLKIDIQSINTAMSDLESAIAIVSRRWEDNDLAYGIRNVAGEFDKLVDYINKAQESLLDFASSMDFDKLEKWLNKAAQLTTFYSDSIHTANSLFPNGNALSSIDEGQSVKLSSDLQELTNALISLSSLIDTHRNGIPLDDGGNDGSKSYALEQTLQQTNSILERMAAGIKIENPDDNNNRIESILLDIQNSISNLPTQLSNNAKITEISTSINNAITELKNVANMLSLEQKKHSGTTLTPSARVANDYGMIRSIAGQTVSNIGSDFKIEKMTELENGVVKVRGAVKGLGEVWKGFEIDVDSSNNAVLRAIDTQSKFATALNKSEQKISEEGKQFAKTQETKVNALIRYRDSIKDSIYFTDEFKNRLNELESQVLSASNNTDITNYDDAFRVFKDDFDINMEKGIAAKIGSLNDIKQKINSSMNSLDFKDTTEGLNEEQLSIVNNYKELLNLISQHQIEVRKGNQIEIAAIESSKKALQDKINVYKQQNNIENAGGSSNKKAYGDTIKLNATAKYNTIKQTAQDSLFENSSVVANLINQYTAAYQNLINMQKQFKVGENPTDAQKAAFITARDECNKYAKALNKVYTDTYKLNELSDGKSFILGGDFDGSLDAKRKALNDFIQESYGATAAIGEFDRGFNQLSFTINNGNGSLTRMKASINAAGTEIRAVAIGTQEVTSTLGRFYNELKNKFTTIGSYLVASFSYYEIINEIKRGVGYVREIDSALTELKKVTSETDETYSNFLKNMSQVGGEIGSTTQSLTNSAADWARLGYSIEEAGELAKNTAILMNVSEFTDINQATDSMISALKAFNYTAEDSLHLVDIFNTIGNNFAISTSDLALSLTKSASALTTAGVDLEQSAALLTGANTIMQDPDTVSQGLKVIALRIRGVKSELEDMGEETDGILNTSKLQGKIKALTGVDLLDETNSFRNIYDILMEIADVWDELDSMSQASVIELMAGKNRANVFTSIMKQADTIKSAYSTALDSEGSAIQENEKHLESVQGRIELFTNAVQTMWANALSSDAVKGFVDAGTAIVKFVDAVGLLPTLSGALVFISELKKGFGEAKISTQDFRKETLELLKAQQSGAATSGVVESINEEVAAEREKTKAKMESSAASAAEATTSEMNATANLVEAEASQIVQTEKAEEVEVLTAAATADRTEASTSQMNATANAAQGAASATSKLGAGLTTVAAGAKVLLGALGKASVVMLGISLLTMALEPLGKLIKEHTKSAEELAQEAEQLKNAYDQVADGIKNNISTIGGLEEEFNRLSKGVNDLGENVSLSADDYKRYQEIVQQLVGISPELVAGYDAEGNALANKNSLIERSIELMEREQQIEARKLTTGDNGEKLQENITKRYKKIEKEKQKETTNFDLNLESSLGTNIDDYVLLGDGRKKSDIYKEFMSQEDANANRLKSGAWFVDNYYDAIVEDLRSADSKLEKYLGTEYVDLLRKNVLQYEENMRIFANELESINKEYNEFLGQKLVGMDEYYTLDKNARGYASSYVMDLDINSENFEAKTKEVENFVEFINANSGAVSEIFDVGAKAVSKTDSNGNALAFEEYKKQIDEFKAELQSDATFDDTQKSWILNTLGLGEDGVVEKEFNGQINHIKGLLKESDADVDSFINKLSTTDLKLALSITAEEGSDTMSFDEFETKLAALRKEKGVGIKATATYSTISESVEKYNAAIEQTNEIFVDGTEVTQEYKDSLSEIGITEEELGNIFSEANPLVVKNSDALNKLVKQSKNSTATNVKLAKSQAMLKYTQLQKEAHKLAQRYDGLNAADKLYLQSVYEEMGALQKSIAKYSILEHTLLGAADAYEKFAEAQEIDGANTYTEQTESMVDALANAFNSAKLGTESAQAAIKGLVPESVYKDLDTLDDKMQAIYDYFTKGKISDYFTLEFDDNGGISSVEMTMENVKKFVEDGISMNNVFTGSWKDFDLDPSIKSLDQLADRMGVTKEMAFATLQEMEKYDINWIGGDFTTLLDKLTPTAKSLKDWQAEIDTMRANNQTSEADKQQEELNKVRKTHNYESDVYSISSRQAELDQKLINGDYKDNIEAYYAELGELNKEMDLVNNGITEKVLGSMDKAKELDSITQKLKDAQDKLKENPEDKAVQDQIEILYEQYAQAVKEKDKLGTVSNFEISTALQNMGVDVDNIHESLKKTQSQIQDTFDSDSFSGVKDYLEDTYGLITEINANGEIEFKMTDGITDTQKTLLHQMNALKADGTIDFSIVYQKALTPEQQAEVDKLTNLTDKQNLIEFYMTMNGQDPVQSALDGIESVLNSIKELLEQHYSVNVDTSSAQTNTNSLLSKLKEIRDGVWDKTVTVTKNIYERIFGGNDVNGTANASGNAYAGGKWGAPKTEEALTGELGPELRVRGNKWELLGENGAEFNKVKRGDIIFNHEQTKQLLKHGHITGRGKMKGGAFAGGTAYAGIHTWTGGYNGVSNDWSGNSSGGNNNSGNNNNSVDEAANDFKEVFDWFEVKLEEINELLEYWGAQLENIVGITGKGAKLDQIIDENKYKLDILAQGFKLYEDYTNKLLQDIPAQYREAAKNGQIAIETFAGDAGEKTLEAINNYREWAKKVADVQQQMEELTQTIADLAKQKFDVIDEGYDNKISLMEAQIDRLKDSISLTEDRGNIASSEYYNAMTNITNDRINKLQEEHKLLQESLDKSVEAGDIAKYSDRWYEMVEAIYNVDKELMECTSSLEEFQNSINELNWDNFDELINRLDYLYSETDNLIGLMEQSGEFINYPKDNEYWSSDDVAWSKEGITSLGLYAQKMEIAEYMSEQYAKAIDNLNKDYNAGKYSMSEYQEKLNELKKSQYDSIKNYYDAQDAIVELNKTRVDAIKTGIEKEIDAYSKLIEKKKEELSVEKDMHDFQKDIAEQQKGISDIERKISALSMDNSASAVAQRKKLEAELAEARSALDESYYDRSIEDQQTALDNELDNFKEQKDAEIEKWEKYLEDVQKVVADSLLTVQTNAIDVYDTLSGKASEYDLTLSDAITLPWQSGSNAVSSYQDTFNTAASSTYEQLGTIKQQWQDIIDLMTKTANIDISNLNADNQSHVAAQKKEPVKQTTTPSNPPTTTSKPNVSVGSAVTVKASATHFATGQRMANFVPGGNYTVYQDNGDRVLIGRDGVYTGWVYKQDIQGYAKGTNGIKKDQLAWIDENGLEELVMHAGPNGRLQYLTKGTSVIPSDISENLMKIGSINPQEILDRNRASVKVNPAVANNNVNINITYGDILHVDNLNGGDTAEIAKIVDARFNKHTKQLNDSLRKYVR
jgi:TP901 family phage tail tape measure protein